MSLPSPAVPVLTPVGSGWARERLWLGMSNVGFWVVIAAAIIAFGMPDLGFGDADALILLGAYVALQAPFDLVGGWWLQRRHRRGAQGLGRFLATWARGVAVQVGLFTLAGASALGLYSFFGGFSVIAGALVGMVMLLGLQGPLIWITTGLRTRTLTRTEADLATQAGLDPSIVRVVHARDDSFVGGWMGLPGAETLVVPHVWSHALSEEGWVAQLRRRAVARASGQRLRGVLLALTWNTAGLAIGVMLYGVADAGALVQVIAAYTLWSFVGVLLLPSASRRGVYAVDSAAANGGADPTALRGALRDLDGLQDDEPARSDVVESIFHPVPALSRREEALRSATPQSGGAWHAARMSLLLSQALASPLSRAVHCNIGRPELWAAYPGD
ncbi:MAG: hypothetical protein AB8H79_05990 [Myxococcota bacterium]